MVKTANAPDMAGRWRTSSYVDALYNAVTGTSGYRPRMGCDTEVQRGTVQGWWESGCLRTTKNTEHLLFWAHVYWSQGFLELHIHRKTVEFVCILHFIINHKSIVKAQLFAG